MTLELDGACGSPPRGGLSEVTAELTIVSFTGSIEGRHTGNGTLLVPELLSKLLRVGIDVDCSWWRLVTLGNTGGRSDEVGSIAGEGFELLPTGIAKGFGIGAVLVLIVPAGTLDDDLGVRIRLDFNLVAIVGPCTPPVVAGDTDWILPKSPAPVEPDGPDFEVAELHGVILTSPIERELLAVVVLLLLLTLPLPRRGRVPVLRVVLAVVVRSDSSTYGELERANGDPLRVRDGCFVGSMATMVESPLPTVTPAPAPVADSI